MILLKIYLKNNVNLSALVEQSDSNTFVLMQVTVFVPPMNNTL